jgi:hypothetical protein
MSVYFEPYSKKVSRASRQGAAIARRVRREPWLQYAHPSVTAKYAGLMEAIGNAWHEAWSQNENHQSRILRDGDEHGPVIGQSMIVTNRVVRHPVEGEFSGTLINYWLAANSSRTAHNEAARALVYAAGSLMLQQDSNVEALPLFTIVSVSDMWPPKGLGLYLEPIGDAAEISVPIDMKDLYEAPNRTRYLQLYYKELLLRGES